MRILVAAASRHGGTSGVAEQIARTLTAAGLDVDMKAPDEVERVTEYDGIVLGSGVYYGQWLPTALDLLRRQRDAIAGMPVWLFSVGPIGAPVPRPEEEPPIVSELLERTKARGHRVFAGSLDRAGLGLLEKAVVTATRAPEGDFRDWGAIREWAEEIASELCLEEPHRG
jgi:menaquinone-dependent protoporphyrinogen oxidase